METLILFDRDGLWLNMASIHSPAAALVHMTCVGIAAVPIPPFSLGGETMTLLSNSLCHGGYHALQCNAHMCLTLSMGLANVADDGPGPARNAP
ncbi:hypothetical protein ACLOJK_006544 [Asimina triloba]